MYWEWTPAVIAPSPEVTKNLEASVSLILKQGPISCRHHGPCGPCVGGGTASPSLVICLPSPLHESDLQNTMPSGKPGDTSGAQQFNEAHYGNQLNAEELDKWRLFTSPSTGDSQTVLMGAHLRPPSVTQPSLSTAVTNLQGDRFMSAWKELGWLVKEDRNRNSRGVQSPGM